MSGLQISQKRALTRERAAILGRALPSVLGVGTCLVLARALELGTPLPWLIIVLLVAVAVA